MANVVSILDTVCTGSVISCPKTGMVSDAVTTTRIENIRKLTGSPSRLPRLTAANDLPYREKSPKLSIGPEKYDTTSAIAPSMIGMAEAPWYLTWPRLRLMPPQPALWIR